MDLDVGNASLNGRVGRGRARRRPSGGHLRRQERKGLGRRVSDSWEESKKVLSRAREPPNQSFFQE